MVGADSSNFGNETTLRDAPKGRYEVKEEDSHEYTERVVVELERKSHRSLGHSLVMRGSSLF